MKTFLEYRDFTFALPAVAILRQRELNGVEKILIAKRLGQKLDGSRLHRAYGHRNVSVGRDEDDRHLDIGTRKFLLEIQTAHSRQADIQDKTAGDFGLLRIQELLRGNVQLRFETHRSQQIPERVAHGWIIFNNKHTALRAFHPWAFTCWGLSKSK